MLLVAVAASGHRNGRTTDRQKHREWVSQRPLFPSRYEQNATTATIYDVRTSVFTRLLPDRKENVRPESGNDCYFFVGSVIPQWLCLTGNSVSKSFPSHSGP